MNVSSEVSQLRKAGRLEDALEKARGAYDATPDDVYLQRAYGWVIYDLVKREVQLFEEQKVPPGRLANRFNEWLSDYRQFGAHDRPGMLHSLLLNQVLKGGKAWPGFLGFARWWGPEYLRLEDKAPYVTDDGKSLPSLQLRLYYSIGRATLGPAGNADAALLDWGRSQLETALDTNPNDQWLHYYSSKLLLNEGKPDEARKCLMPVVKRQQRAAWAWALLGHTYEHEAPETAITCYFRAIQVAKEPQEVAKTRIVLAGLLAKAGRFEEATVQVRLVLDYRFANSYSVPQTLAQMAGSDWYRELAGRQDLPPEPDVSKLTDTILYGGESGELDYTVGVLDNQNSEKSLAHVAFNPDRGVVLSYRKFMGIDNVPLGNIVEVAVDPEENKPVRWRKSTLKVVPGLVEVFMGEVSQRPGQAFGFLVTEAGDRIFIHPPLMSALPIAEATSFRCLAMMGKDKQGKSGWRALRWMEGSEPT